MGNTAEGVLGAAGVPRQEWLELPMLREFYLFRDISLCCPCTFQARVRQFRKWLATRNEKVIAVVGHGMYFNALEGGGAEYFDNVEVRKFTFRSSTQELELESVIAKPRCREND